MDEKEDEFNTFFNTLSLLQAQANTNSSSDGQNSSPFESSVYEASSLDSLLDGAFAIDPTTTSITQELTKQESFVTVSEILTSVELMEDQKTIQDGSFFFFLFSFLSFFFFFFLFFLFVFCFLFFFFFFLFFFLFFIFIFIFLFFSLL